MANGLTGFLDFLQSYASQVSTNLGFQSNDATSLSRIPGAGQIMGGDVLGLINNLSSGQSTLPQIDSQLSQYLNPSQSKAEALVWLGQREATPQRAVAGKLVPSYEQGGPKIGGGPRGVLADQAAYEPLSWSDSKRDEMYKKVGQAVGTDITSFSQFRSFWNTAIGIAQESWSATDGGKNGKLLSVWDVFDLMKREGSKYGYANSGGIVPRTITQRSTTVNKLSDGGVWALIKSAAQRSLGRNPTSDEVRAFAARANSIAVNNPTISTSTVTNDASGNTSTKTTTKQGAGIDDFQQAADKRVDTAEAGAYQAATTYFNAMVSALDSVV